MKKILFYAAFISMFSLGSLSATEIATINLDEVIKNSKVMSTLNKRLEEERGKIEKELKAEEAKLNAEKNTLESQIKTLSQEVAQQKVVDFQQKILAFQQEVQKSEADLQKTYVDSVMEITEAIKEVTSEMKEEKNSKYNFDIVLPLSSAIYSEDALDISSEVLSRLNKKLKKLNSLE